MHRSSLHVPHERRRASARARPGWAQHRQRLGAATVAVLRCNDCGGHSPLAAGRCQRRLELQPMMMLGWFGRGSVVNFEPPPFAIPTLPLSVERKRRERNRNVRRNVSPSTCRRAGAAHVHCLWIAAKRFDPRPIKRQILSGHMILSQHTKQREAPSGMRHQSLLMAFVEIHA